jgi:orotate phosphoribosyltransferase
MTNDEQDWATEFGLAGAYWLHDKNPKRPYALLTSGLISNGFFNGGRVGEDGTLFARACVSLWQRAQEHGLSGMNLRFVGAAMGGICLSSRLAEAGKCRSAYAERCEDEFVFLRPDFRQGENFLLVEDTITTGKTLDKLLAAIREKSPSGAIANMVLALCNRSGSAEYKGMPILSLISPVFETWHQGENPFTPDGKELVPPVRPKQNWYDLVRNYS